MLCLVYGSQTALQYSSVGLLKVLYAMCLMSGVHLCRFLLRNPIVLLDMLSVCVCHKTKVVVKIIYEKLYMSGVACARCLCGCVSFFLFLFLLKLGTW